MQNIILFINSALKKIQVWTHNINKKIFYSQPLIIISEDVKTLVLNALSKTSTYSWSNVFYELWMSNLPTSMYTIIN